MQATQKLPDRLAKLIELASSQADLSRISGVTEGTLINWQRGLGYHESTLRKFCEQLDISLAWLRDGTGDEDREIKRFARRIREWTLSTRDEESCRVREEPLPSAMLPAPANCHRIIEHLTRTMSPEHITTALGAVMNDTQLSAEERRRTGQALSEILSIRLSREHESIKRKN
jgi:hypothetical protein